MKERLHRFFSCSMALLLLASTTSWTVGKHYCMGHLMDVSLFSQADDCGMDMTMADAKTEKAQNEKSCCNDELIVIDGQDDLKISLNDFSFDQQVLLVAFKLSYLSLFEISAEQAVLNEHYPPPLLVRNIQLLDEVFII